MKTSKADKWFSLFIRLRDCDDDRMAKCCTCGRMVDVKHADCGHFIKRQHQNTRFDEMNCAVQCKRCNAFEQGRDADFERYLIERYGADKVAVLKACGAMSKHRSQWELDVIADIYKAKAKALAAEKGIKMW